MIRYYRDPEKDKWPDLKLSRTVNWAPNQSKMWNGGDILVTAYNVPRGFVGCASVMKEKREGDGISFASIRWVREIVWSAFDLEGQRLYGNFNSRLEATMALVSDMKALGVTKAALAKLPYPRPRPVMRLLGSSTNPQQPASEQSQTVAP